MVNIERAILGEGTDDQFTVGIAKTPKENQRAA